MDNHTTEQIFKLLLESFTLIEKLDTRLKIIEEKFSRPSMFNSISYTDPDPLLPKAVELTLKHKKASASLIQRFLKVGYARAALILDQMETAGVVGNSDGAKPRKIFVDKCTDFLSLHKPTTQDEYKR